VLLLSPDRVNALAQVAIPAGVAARRRSPERAGRRGPCRFDACI